MSFSIHHLDPEIVESNINDGIGGVSVSSCNRNESVDEKEEVITLVLVSMICLNLVTDHCPSQ